MRQPDPRFDPVAGEWRTTQPLPGPRVTLARYRHTCPDGTRVGASAQVIPVTGGTLYRWRVGGVSAGSTWVPGIAGEPDWTAIDAAHPLFLPAAAEEIEPDCYVCGDAGCQYCRPGGHLEPADSGWEWVGAPVADAAISGPTVARVPAGIDDVGEPAACDALPF